MRRPARFNLFVILWRVTRLLATFLHPYFTDRDVPHFSEASSGDDCTPGGCIGMDSDFKFYDHILK